MAPSSADGDGRVRRKANALHLDMTRFRRLFSGAVRWTRNRDLGWELSEISGVGGTHDYLLAQCRH